MYNHISSRKLGNVMYWIVIHQSMEIPIKLWVENWKKKKKKKKIQKKIKKKKKKKKKKKNNNEKVKARESAYFTLRGK